MNSLITLSSFFYNKHDIPVTQKRVHDLICTNYLDTYYVNDEVHFDKAEIMKLVELERTLSNEYVIASTFLTLLNGSNPHPTLKKNCEAIYSMCTNIHKIDTLTHFGKKYYAKKDIRKFLSKVITKDEIMKKLNINIYVYYQVLKKANIPVIAITRNIEYIPKSKLPTFMAILLEYSHKNNQERWIKGTTIIKSNLISDLILSNEMLIKTCVKCSVKHFFDRYKVFYVEYHSLMSFYRKQLSFKYNFFTLNMVKDLFDMHPAKTPSLNESFLADLLKLCDESDIQYVKTNNKFTNDTIFFRKEHILAFIKDYFSSKDVVAQFEINPTQLKYLVNLHNINYFKLNNRLKFYNRSEVFHMMETDYTKLYLNKSNKFYTLMETLKILEINESKLNTVRRENDLKYVNMHNTTYYLKKDIIRLVEIKNETLVNFVPSSLVKKKLGEHSFAQFKIKKNPKGIERFAHSDFSKTALLFSKDEYIQILKKKTKQQLINSISYDDPVTAFHNLLNIHEIRFSDASTLTETHWLKHCEDSILHSEKSLETKMYFVNELVMCTKLISEFVNRVELHQKTSKEINFGLFNKSIPIRHQSEIFSFINKFYYQLLNEKIAVNFKNTLIKKNHQIDSGSINQNQNNRQDMTIYDYEIFQGVYTYLNSLCHLEKAIEDSLIKLYSNSKDLSYNYAYSWFYTLIHLNNAWRHRDICNIQMIDISSIEISSIEELKFNKLSENEIDSIVNLLLAKNYKVAKTQANNNLYISNEIKTSLAYAYLLCHLINKQLYPTSKRVINFSNKNNNFLSSYNKSLFSNFSKNFQFKNRKMNRTLLTVMYTLLTKNNQSGAALNIAKRLRAHISEESTNFYIKIPDEDLNNLSINLFNRGIFGYIPKILSEIILGESDNFVEETKKINKIQSVFQNIYQIEATSGFLNNIFKQRESIHQLFIKNGIEVALETLNKLQMNSLPGKDENFQCLINDLGCKYTNLSCKNCAYSVPNFFAIANLTSSVQSSLTDFKSLFLNAKYENERIKHVNLLFMELDLLDDAMNIFGEEVILEFFEGEKEEYLLLLDQLNLNSDKPLTEYATYNLKEGELNES